MIWGPSAPSRLNYVTSSPYHLPFNLLDGIWNPPDLDESGAESAGPEGGSVTQHVCPSTCAAVCSYI